MFAPVLYGVNIATDISFFPDDPSVPLAIRIGFALTALALVYL